MSTLMDSLASLPNRHSERSPASTQGAMPTAAWLRGLLLAGCLASVAMVGALTQTTALQEADPDLVRLLRGMALIKASLVVAAFGVLWWRAGHALDARIACGYGAGLCWMAGASVAIWQLSHIVMAAGFFHAGLAAVLWAAWRDGGQVLPTARW